jgi:arylformamidase
MGRLSGYFDISPEISEHIAVFPGDTPYRRQVALDLNRGDNLTLSRIETTVHLGAHADAPSHYDARGEGIGARPLELYHGDCQVLRVPNRGPAARLRPADLAAASIEAPRVLLRTDSFPYPNRWTDGFCALSAELIDFLADRGVRLVGIDTPSVDPAQDARLETHRAVWRRDLAILEGLVLTDVPDGIYHLTALPLRLRDADASPVRAVLWKK